VNLTEACIRKPVMAWMLFAATALFGVIAFWRIGISQMPDVDYPTLTVTVEWAGAAPEAVEREIIDPVEEALTQVEGLRAITSSAQRGSGQVTLELNLERNVDLALQDASTRIAQVQRRLPADAERPVIAKTNPEDEPIIWLGLSGPYPQRTLADYARYAVKERMQAISGIGEITMAGYLDRNIRIWIDPDRLAAKNLTVVEVITALKREHLELPGGKLQSVGRELTVRVLGEAFDLAGLRRLVVGRAGPAAVYLEDVALVEDGLEDAVRVARFNGEPTQGMGVRKQRGANAIAVADAVRTTMVALQANLPADMRLVVTFDNTAFIRESVHELQFELCLSVLLTALVCWLFLRSLSTTLNVVLAIPMSLLGTVAVCWFCGFTLNTFTLLGLGLAVGIVVDDAIMVLENIVRHAEKGADRATAARTGVGEIAFAALAASAAIVAVFLPVVFMQGIIGKFFLQFGVALCVAVAFSYLEAVTLAPSRCAQFLHIGHARAGGFGAAVDRTFAAIERAYGRLLAVVVRRPWLVLSAAALLCAASVGAFLVLPWEMVPSQDQSRLRLRVQTAVGADIGETDRLMRRAEAYLAARPEVTGVYAVSGAGGTNRGMMFLTLVPPSQRALGMPAFISQVRRDLNAFAGLTVRIQDPSQDGFASRRAGAQVEFAVQGPDWNVVVDKSEELMGRLAVGGNVVDLDSDYRLGQPELAVVPDRARLSDLEVPVEDLAATVNALVGGIVVGKFQIGERRVDLRLRTIASARTRPEDLGRLHLRSGSGELLPLTAVARYDEHPSLQAITRRDRQRAVTITANPAPGHAQQDAIATVRTLAAEVLPPGYRVAIGGASAVFEEAIWSLLLAVAVGLAVAYMILAAQFDSFRHPVTVLAILPLSVAGALVALWLSGKTLNIFSMIGVLLLIGLAKKNSIILVDYANRLRAEGLGAAAAMVGAGPVRLRPILMTSIATILAAVPLALGLGPGGEVRTPMAIVVIGGMAVATTLSLLVVPAFYVVIEGLVGKRGDPQGDAAPPAPDAAVR